VTRDFNSIINSIGGIMMLWPIILIVGGVAFGTAIILIYTRPIWRTPIPDLQEIPIPILSLRENAEKAVIKGEVGLQVDLKEDAFRNQEFDKILFKSRLWNDKYSFVLDLDFYGYRKGEPIIYHCSEYVYKNLNIPTGFEINNTTIGKSGVIVTFKEHLWYTICVTFWSVLLMGVAPIGLGIFLLVR